MLFKKHTPKDEPRARNPQLSARPASVVFSYHANRSVRETTNQFREAAAAPDNTPSRRVRIPWRRRITIIAATCLLLLCVTASLQLNNNVKVVTAGTVDSTIFLRDHSVYAAAAKKEFTNLQNSNKITVNSNQIVASLHAQFPELKTISVALPFLGNQPVVYIQPSTPKLILMSQNSVYVIDGSGRALIASNQVTTFQQLSVPVVTDQSGLSTSVGRIALPSDTVAFISQFVGQLTAKKLSITSLILPAGSAELHVKLSGVGYEIHCNLHGDARLEAGTYLATKQYLEGQHKTPSQYVDVRVDGKAFYK